MQKNRRWITALVVLLVLAAAVFAVVAYQRHRHAEIARELEAELYRIRAAGRPVAIEDLALPPVPDDENAAILYELAFQLIPGYKTDDRLFLTSTIGSHLHPGPASLTPEDVARARKILLNCARFFSLMEEALLRPSCRFDQDFSRGFAAKTPPLLLMRQATELLACRAHLQLLDNNADGAASDLQTASRLSHSLDKQPTIIAYMIRTALEYLIARAICDIAASHRLSPEALDALEADLESVSSGNDFAYALAGERVLLCQTLIQQYRGSIFRMLRGNVRVFSSRGVMGFPAQLRFKSRFDEEELVFLRMSRRLEELASLPYYQAKDSLDNLAKEAASIGSPLLGGFPVHRRTFASRTGNAAFVSLARVVLAAEKYLAAHGRYPDVSPLNLIDPFDGKPLRYRLDDNGLVIWSVGEDLDDDLAQKEWNPSTRDGDILWRIPLPKHDRNAPTP
ncbi:MAG: hypothetical protein V2A58_05965 [Planctomycetota bacterium]